MAIPDYQRIMLPLLRFASDGKIHSIHDAYVAMTEHFGLTEEERRQLLPSGKQRIIDNRVGGRVHTCSRQGCCTHLNGAISR